MRKSVDWFVYNNIIDKHCKVKGVNYNSKNSTYLQLVHVHLITCQFLMSLALKHFVDLLIYLTLITSKR